VNPHGYNATGDYRDTGTSLVPAMPYKTPQTRSHVHAPTCMVRLHAMFRLHPAPTANACKPQVSETRMLPECPSVDKKSKISPQAAINELHHEPPELLWQEHAEPYTAANMPCASPRPPSAPVSPRFSGESASRHQTVSSNRPLSA
jgi:hypothetical protein